MKINQLILKGFAITLLLSFVIIGCDKEEINRNSTTTSPISDTPSIAVLKVSPNQIREYRDSIELSISYQDKSGDIGFPNADSLSLYVYDSRDTRIVEKFHIPPLTPIGAKVTLKGVLNVKLPFTTLLKNQTEEKTKFSVKLKDRAGNWSNLASSEEVTVVK